MAALLAGWGAAIVDADAISRQLTAPGGAALAAIQTQFGRNYLNGQGALNRDAMRELVFSQPAKKSALEAILHPLVAAEIKRQATLAEEALAPCIVFDVPLLVESPHWRQQVEQIVVVDCTQRVQLQRVMRRNGWTAEATQQVIGNQAGRLQRLEAADICIFNDTVSLQALALLVRQLANRFGL